MASAKRLQLLEPLPLDTGSGQLATLSPFSGTSCWPRPGLRAIGGPLGVWDKPRPLHVLPLFKSPLTAITIPIKKIHHLKEDMSVVLSRFTRWCKPHHDLSPEHFHQPKRKPCTYYQSIPILPAPSPWQPLVYFPCLPMCLFWNFHARGAVQHAFSASVSLTHHDVFKVLLWWSMRQLLLCLNTILSYG